MALKTVLFIMPFLIAVSFVLGLWYLSTSLFIISASLSLYMIIRNEQVFYMRIGILEKFGVDAYKKTTDYDTMMRDFWIPMRKYKDETLLKAAIISGGE